VIEVKKKIKEGMVLVREAQYHGTNYDFLIWAEPSYLGKYRVQIRYDNAEDFMKGLVPFKERVEQAKKGWRPGSGNALPVEFNLSDAKKIVLAIANSRLYRS